MSLLIKDLGGVDAREEYVCLAETLPGAIVQTTDGLLGYVMGSRAYATGEKAPITTDALVSLDSASATTFSAGGSVYWNMSTKLAVASGAHPHAGGAIKAKTSGQLLVDVRLNKLKLAAGS
jgi:predicted RecA/RadA family phage recombinase